MNEDKDVVDFFTEELNKKEKKLQKKKEKERKKLEKKNKRLEKQEDIEFAKKLEEKKLEKEEEFNTPSNNLEMTRANLFNFDIPKEKKHSFLNFILGLFLIILFLVSCDYFIYSVLKEKDLEIIITSSLLCCLSIFYILSIIINNVVIKKIFQILATISIAVYMLYYLFII